MVAERENIQVTEEKELLQQRTQGSRNEMEIVFDAVSCNESFARVAVAAFITHLNPTLEELADIKTAVSEGKNRGKHKHSCFGGHVYAIHADRQIQRIFRMSGLHKIVEILPG